MSVKYVIKCLISILTQGLSSENSAKNEAHQSGLKIFTSTRLHVDWREKKEVHSA
jgi:hypothetical protein